MTWKRLAAVVTSIGLIVAVACQAKREKTDEAPAPSAKPQQTGALSSDMDPLTLVPEDPAPPPPAAPHKPFLYEVTRKGSKPSYIFGTMHLGFDYHALPLLVWESMSKCDTVVLEADIRELAGEAQKRIRLPEGESLADKLGVEAWAKLVAIVGEGMAPALAKTQPWYATTIVLARLFPTALPLDLAVLREAEKSNKKLVFLETIAFQLDLISDVMTPNALAQLVDEGSEMRALLEAGANAYHAGDFEALMKASLDPTAIDGGAAMLDRFIFARNRDWVGKLVPRLEKGGVFIAVGAGHLGAKDGLIALLRANELRVERVSK